MTPPLKQKKIRELTHDDLLQGFRSVGLTEGDMVLVQSSYIALRKVSGGPTAVVRALLDVLGPEGTLLMPTFNWTDFGEKKRYSKLTTKPQTGVISETLMGWKDCQRIYHPLHGFSLVGRQAAALASKIRNESSFERCSLFGELHRQNAKLLLLGVSYRQALTFFHYVEECVGVPYRKYLFLEGEVEELDGSVHPVRIKYYGRVSLQQKYNLDHLQPALEDDKGSVVRTGKIGLATVKAMNAAEVYDRLASVLKINPNLVLE